MGGWYSSTSSTEEQKIQAAANYPTTGKGWFDARTTTEQNNNDQHVVIIPMDLSQHADCAFECKYCMENNCISPNQGYSINGSRKMPRG